jgi:hypothetical protein
MKEGKNVIPATVDSVLAENVLPFSRRILRTEPYLTDDERVAVRRVIALLPELEETVRRMNIIATACPTARRELSGR